MSRRPGRPNWPRRQQELLPRFAAYYTRLQALPRRLRHRLQRRFRQSLAGLALLLALGQVPALAASIAVDGTTCTLIDAITAANTDTATGGCVAGSGADTLVLQQSSVHTLTAVDNYTYEGPTGLPVITSPITIAGNGSTIQRASSAPGFRIFFVESSGELTLQATTVSGGGGVPRGGGVLNAGGTVTLARTLVSGNYSVQPSTVPGSSSEIRGTVTADNYNLFGHDGAAGVYGFTPGPTDVVPTVPLSAILNPTLANNGGPTQTHTLVSGSPAIDASPDDAFCPDTDQRGVARPQGAACDIGAVESQAAFAFSGFFPPVDNPDVLNQVKAGASIPVKFSLGGDEGLAIFMPDSPGSQEIVCDTAASVDAIEETVTAGGSSLTNDPTTEQYTYVWKTAKVWANTCRQLLVQLIDGTMHLANFKFTK